MDSVIDHLSHQSVANQQTIAHLVVVLEEINGLFIWLSSGAVSPLILGAY
jgi:hypothetical protein